MKEEVEKKREPTVEDVVCLTVDELVVRELLEVVRVEEVVGVELELLLLVVLCEPEGGKVWVT